MKRSTLSKKIISITLAVLMAFTGLAPAVSAYGADGVEGYYDIELFYKDSDTIVPSDMLNDKGETVDFIQYMVEGEELKLTYKLIDTAMPDSGYIRWYSETPTLVDVNQEGLVKAFDSSKGAVIHTWLDNEVRTIPLVGDLIAKAIEKVIFNDTINVDTMDTEAIIALVEGAFGSDSLLSKWIESYKGELIDSLRYYLDNINSNIHVQLYAADGELLDDDMVRICVTKNNEWYAAFLPNGTHITNKSQINTTVAVGSQVQLYAVTTPVRLRYGCIYSVKSTSVFDQGKVIATVDDTGLVKFKNTGTVTIQVSPDTEQIIQNILKLIGYFYEINGEMIDSHQLADILIKYVGIDINRNVLAALLDTILAIYDVASGVTDPVKLAATAAKVIGNLVMQFVYNDTITFTVVEAQPITNFKIDGASSVREGSEIQLSIVDVEPAVGDTSDITWYSSDPTVASVDEKTGVITGRDAGGTLGSLSTKECTIYAVSAANGVEKSHKITVTGRMGSYISDVEIIGKQYLEMGQSADYMYSLYPKRVAENDNLYITWGIVTGEDEEGNTTYAWADAENTATDGRGVIDSRGHYTVVSGGVSNIVIKAQTGYYLANGNFYEVSNLIKSLEVTNGIPVENITLSVSDSTGIFSSTNSITTQTIEGSEHTFVSVKAVTQYAGLGAIINASVYPENASNKNLTWVIDNNDFENSTSNETHTATVKMKVFKEGADCVNVYAVSADGLTRSNTITVCVSKNVATSNVINQDSIEVVRGRTADATHTIGYEKSSDGTYSACYKCNWYSSDETIFTVKAKNNDNRDATITAVDVGTATLTCVSADGGIIDTCQVTVYPDKDYLRNIVSLCDKTVVRRTSDNAALYKKYSNRLDLAYTVLYDQPMASQTTCDTYADELLYAFYKLGGFIGLSDVRITEKGGKPLTDRFITVDVGSVSNYTNYSYEFDYIVMPENAMYSSVTWTSSSSKLTVDKNGICRPKDNDPCAAIITCTVTDYMGNTTSDSVCIAFSRNAATGVSLNTTQIDGGKIGETQQLTATVSPTGAIGGASNTSVYWTSSDPSIATVDENGVVSFKEGGRCVITATTIDGGYTADCNVTVVTNYTQLALLVQQYNDLALNPSNYFPESFEVYSSAMADAQAMLAAADSSQKEVDAMYARLEAAYNSLEKYTYIQKIELYLDGEQTSEFYQYDLSVFNGEIRYTDAVLDLNIRLYPNNGSYQSVVWQSSTTDIAVTSDGKCSPTIKNSCYGMITCTVTDHYGNSFTDFVWVSFSRFPVTSLDLSDDNISGAVGDTYQLRCTVKPTGDSLLHIGAASIKDYYWESLDESVATVDETGLVTFTGAGATIVRAVSYDGGIAGECAVSTEGDRTALMRALEEYRDINFDQYQYSYGMEFRSAYQEAERALTDITYTQDMIDSATLTLVNAYNEMVAHPFVLVSGIDVTYTTTKDPTFGKETQVASGTVSNNNALSVNLSGSDYANYNSNNWATLTAGVSPSNAMCKSITWRVDSSSGLKESTISGASIKLKPKDTNKGAWAIITAIATDDYDRITARTIYVTLSDKVCTGFDITDGEQTIYATAAARQINYTISGSPEFSNVIWSSSNENAVRVDSNGIITPVEKGTAVITGKTVDGGFSDTVTVNVITDFSSLASKQGEYYSLIENVRDSYTYTEESIDRLAEAVNTAQIMINEGKATQAEVNEAYNELVDAFNNLEEYIPVTSVSIVADETDEIKVVRDGYIHLIATQISRKSIKLKPLFNADNAKYTSITWKSSNSSIVIDSSGLLTNNGITSGVTEVTCTVTNVFDGTYTAKAYVAFARYAVSGISFEDEMVYGAPSKTAQLSPTITNTGNSSMQSFYIKDCTYTSSDPSIATVDDNGVVTFITQGEAVITATTKDGGYSASITAYTTWDTTALTAAIEKASKLTYTNYAYTYGMAFKQALENAKAVEANVYASQQEIDAACTALTEAMSVLEDNRFIVPQINLAVDGESISTNAIVQVSDDTQQNVISLALNEGAMVKSSEIIISDESNVSVVLNGNDITITRLGDDSSLTITVKAVDDYDREYQKIYTISVIEQLVNVTSIALTADGNVVSGSLVRNCGGTYNNFTNMIVGYIPTPENANSVTSVKYESSAKNYVKIDEKTGEVTLTLAGKARSSNTTTITCTVTNTDGSTVSASFSFTITRA